MTKIVFRDVDNTTSFTTTSLSRSIRIDKLIGASNYRPWQIRMKVYLRRLHLWAYIDGSNPKPEKTDPNYSTWEEKDFEAQSEIQFHVTDTLMYLIANEETAKEMWDCLKEQYEKTDTIHAIALFRQLTTYHMEEGDDFETFLETWRSLLEQGTIAGLGFTDKQHVVMLLAALPPSWRPFVTTQSYQTQTLIVLINKMRQENTFSKLSNGTMNQPIAPMAMATSLHKPNPHQRPNYYSRPQYNTNKPNQPHCNYCQRQGHWEKDCRIKARNSNYQSNTQITCNYCKRIGHMERECRTKQREVNMQPQARMAQIQEETSSGDEMYLFNLNLTNTTGVDSAWYLDTGATHHMTYDKKLLAEFKELPTPLEVHLGDDSIREAKGFGTITFNLPNNKHLQIHKVYFVPGLTKNLISVSQATQSGFTITFKGNSCILQPQLHDRTPIVISCPQLNNLYPIPLKVITMFNASHQILDNISENTLKWHYRLGHPHLQVLYTL